MSIRDLARQTGLNRDTLWKAETGQTPRPRGTTLHKIARALRIDYDMLVDPAVGLEVLRERLRRQTKRSAADWPPLEPVGKLGFEGAVALGKGRMVPVFPIGADHERDWTDGDFPTGFSDDYFPVSAEVNDPGAFYCRVFGDSMEPSLSEGDLLLFAPNQFGEVRDGDICLVRTHDYATVKRVYAAQGEMIRLVPDNRVYPDRLVHRRNDVVQLHPAVRVVKQLLRRNDREPLDR